MAKKINNRYSGSIKNAKINQDSTRIKQKTIFEESNDHVILDFQFCTLKGFKKDEYTNYCTNENEYSKLLSEVIIKGTTLLAQRKRKEVLQAKNSHLVIQDKIPLVLEYIEYSLGWDSRMIDMHGIGSENKLHYISIQGTSIRLVGWFEGGTSIFKVCMIDYHHLIHPNKFYNQQDYKKNSFCPIERYKF